MAPSQSLRPQRQRIGAGLSPVVGLDAKRLTLVTRQAKAFSRRRLPLAVAEMPGSLQQRAQHPGGFLVHLQALGQKVGGGLIAGVVGQREHRARGLGAGFVGLHQ